MKATFLPLTLVLYSAMAIAQQTNQQPVSKQPVYTPPQPPVTQTLPKADPVQATPPPTYVAPPGIRATQANKVEAVPAKARAEFEAEMQSKQAGSSQRVTTAQPADFDSVAVPKDPDPQVQPPQTRN